jgi:hypothetical protein
VANGHWLDMVIYIVRSSARIRLGTVAGLGTRTFLLTGGATPAGTVQLLADPIGSDSVFVTEPIAVLVGQRVTLRLEPTISFSSYVLSIP